MIDHDDAFVDSVAVLALGALPQAEALAVAAHVSACAECRTAYDALRSVAGLVGYEAESTVAELDEVSAARMKSRVMRAVRADAAPATAAASRPWFAYALAVAAVVVAMVSTADVVKLRARESAQAQNIAALTVRTTQLSTAGAVAEAQRRAVARRLALVVAPGSKHFAISRGEVVESRGRILIALSGMSAAPAGKVYQAWTLARGSKAVAPSVTFVADANGNAVVELPEGAANLVAVAVSVEPAGGSKAPTSKPTFIRTLS